MQEACHARQGALGSPGVCQEAEGVRGDMGKSLNCGFHGKDLARQGKQLAIGWIGELPWALGLRAVGQSSCTWV